MSVPILGPPLPPFAEYLQQQVSLFGTQTTRRPSPNMSSAAALPPSSLVQTARPAKKGHFFRDIVRGEALYTLLGSKSNRGPENQAVRTPVPEPAIRRSARARAETIRQNTEELERVRAREERRQRRSSSNSAFSLQTVRRSLTSKGARQQQQQQAPQPSPLTLEQEVRRNQQRGRGIERAASGFLTRENSAAASPSSLLATISEQEQQPHAVQEAKPSADLAASPTSTGSFTAVASCSPSSHVAGGGAVSADVPRRGTKSADHVDPPKDSGMGSTERPLSEAVRKGDVSAKRPSIEAGSSSSRYSQAQGEEVVVVMEDTTGA
ncbi:MAG: hypothetical protein LQ348_006730 [Seirophora lacunosa]|nr:MAG: hypothetical protein LQ344_001455 [Seirophora lacunosa]KAI4172576.1 MAG: hypothetical protein LQ348_006730 [Seirophora lacunosa]